MNNFKSLFLFNRKQQRGILILILLLVIIIGFYTYTSFTKSKDKLVVEDVGPYQSQIDSLKILAFQKKNIGLTEEQLGHLHRFRESGKFINSKKDFQKITGVSDKWLDSISPYFKFPDWVTNPKKKKAYASFKERKVVVKDINNATQDELKVWSYRFYCDSIEKAFLCLSTS